MALRTLFLTCLTGKKGSESLMEKSGDIARQGYSFLGDLPGSNEDESENELLISDQDHWIRENVC